LNRWRVSSSPSSSVVLPWLGLDRVQFGNPSGVDLVTGPRALLETPRIG
jgi:hypothetical protein